MKIVNTPVRDLLVIEPKVFGDARGYFFESWQSKRYADLGIKETFVQDNISFSERGILRGLHFQNPHAQGKLVSVLDGAVFDVAVDIRQSSPTFGQSFWTELSSDNHRQLYIPPGFAHGFCVLSETALFSYKCTDFYHPETEFCLIWNDPDLSIPWPIRNPVLSKKDQEGFQLKSIPPEKLLPYV